MRILVTGSKGQLGSEIQQLAITSQHHFTFLDKEDVDFSKPDTIPAVLSVYSFDCLINAAAYTAVDQAEDEEELAHSINAESVGKLVDVCRKKKALFIHVSTDFVFDGLSSRPYTELDSTNPIGVYGLSKRQGEKKAMEYDKSVVIRTSWLYSSYGKNFVKTIRSLANNRDELHVVEDQVGSPTYAGDLAAAILCIADQGVSKAAIYHYSNKGEISWYTFAKKIVECFSLTCQVLPTTSSAYKTKAKRPAYSVLSTEKIEKEFEIRVPDWESSLQKCIRKIIDNETDH